MDGPTTGGPFLGNGSYQITDAAASFNRQLPKLLSVYLHIATLTLCKCGVAMEFSSLQEGVLERRYKRFLADVVLPDGQRVTAHCPNTGAMTGCAPPGARVWLSASTNPKRKLAWTLELVETPEGLVCVHSALANRVVEESLLGGLPVALAGFEVLKREVKYGQNSRADFRLDFTVGAVMVEVKAVTLLTERGLGLFPDAVSARARRHVEDLAAVVAAGQRAALVFCVLHEGIERVAPAESIDPDYSAALKRAVRSGVEVYALRTAVSPVGVMAIDELPVTGL